MKILFIVIGSLALLIFAIVLIGALLPKHHVVTRSAIFHARPEQLFGVISGPPTWRPDVKKFEPINNPAGPEQWREIDNHGQAITYEVVERKEPVLLKTRIATPNLPYGGGWTFVLREDDGLTTLRITEEGDVYNPFFRFISRFIIGQTRSINSYLINLAKVLGEKIQIRD